MGEHVLSRREAVATSVLVGISTALLTGWLLLVGTPDSAEVVPSDVGLVAHALILAAAACLYVYWRVGASATSIWRRRLSGWLIVGLMVTATQGLLHAAVENAQVATGTAVSSRDHWALLSQLLTVAVLCAMARIAEQMDVPGDPALVGALAGAALGVLSVAVTWLPPLVLGDAAHHALNTLLLIGGLVLAWQLLQRHRASWWVRRRLALAAIAVTGAQYADNIAGLDAVISGLAGGALAVGALLICATAFALFRTALQEYQAQMRELRSALVETRADVHEQRELLHELGSTLAGIASASEIIRKGAAVPAPRRRRLERMLEAEVARLVRLMSDRAASSEPAEVDLDDVLGTIVLSHQTRGRDVRWSPSGLLVDGRADDLAEVFNILLENAARHAWGAPIVVSVRKCGGMVEIECADFGPGVPVGLRAQLFDSGVRGPDSPGQGLGLSIAQRLMADLGGSLELRDTAVGATFVATLPAQLLDERTAHVVSHAS